MPFKDQEKQREAQRRSMAKARVSPTGESAPKCETLDVKPDYSQNVYFRPQPQVVKGTEEWDKTRESLQWGIDTGRIRCRREVVEAYDLVPKYGPALLDKHELLTLLNGDIKQKGIDAPLYFLQDDDFELKYSYSKDWYK